MKKFVSIILALALALSLACTAYADEVPQPEGGKKFESGWAIFNTTIRIIYEEEGYRVSIRKTDPSEHKITEWDYSCYYVEAEDVLKSVSSSKRSYAINPETGESKDSTTEYDDLDGENTVTVFRITGDGFLNWEDGRGQDGFDSAFSKIGDFEGVWRSEDNYVWTEIEWNDSEEDYGYFVYLHRGFDDVYAEFTAKGLYNPETGRLEVRTIVPVATSMLKDGSYETEYDEDEYELFFSELGGGKILFEAENGVELIYDLMGSAG